MATIFDNYIQPVRSLTQRMADLEGLDLQREELGARRQQNAMTALTMRRQMEADEAGRRQGALMQDIARQAGGDENAMVRLLRGAGMFDPAAAIEKSIAERLRTTAQTRQAEAATKKSEVDADKERLQMVRDQGAMILQAVSAAKDPQSYAVSRQWLASQGLDVSQVPEQFSPQYVQQAGQMAMTAVQRAEQEWKAKGYDLDVRNAQSADAARKASTAQGWARIAEDKRQFGIREAREAAGSVAEAGGPGQAALVKQFGKPPKDHRWKADGSAEPIPGGPADIKAGELGEKREARKIGAIEQAKSVLGTIKDARDLVGVTTAGVGGLTRAVPATPGRDLSAKLETIKANLGFDRLQQMREQSPTGGALGQVAVQELTALQATVASLDQLQSPGEVRKALDKIEGHYKRWAKTVDPQFDGGAGGSWESPQAQGEFKIIGVKK